LESFLIMHLFSISFVFGAFDYGMAMLGEVECAGEKQAKERIEKMNE